MLLTKKAPVLASKATPSGIRSFSGSVKAILGQAAERLPERGVRPHALEVRVARGVRGEAHAGQLIEQLCGFRRVPDERLGAG
jgi:hypothetical protein